MRPLEKISLYTIAVGFVSVLFLSSVNYIYNSIFFSTKMQVAQALEAKMFDWLATQQGAQECRHDHFVFEPSSLVWTDANVLKSTFMPPLPKQHDWVLEDQVDFALDLLRGHPHVLHIIKDGDLYFATGRPTYSISCRISRIFQKVFLLVRGD